MTEVPSSRASFEKRSRERILSNNVLLASHFRIIHRQSCDAVCLIPFFLRETLKNSSIAANDSTEDVGTCRDIPAGLRVEFLVSEAGKYKGVAQMEVVGVRVR